MTTSRTFSESEGEFTRPDVYLEEPCAKCGGRVREQCWESSDGAYEDWKYTCVGCGRVVWVDGIDS